MSDSSQRGRDSASELEATVAGTPMEGHPEARGETPRIAKGDALGRYVVLDQVGHGGMGRVYKAYDPKLKREVALKLLRTTASDMEVRAVREAQAMAALAHPNVVPVYDVDRDGGRLYIAMEFIPGQTLRAWLKQHARSPGPKHWREVLGLMLQAGRGLAAAHAAGLVHRDLKPANIVVGEDGRVRVMDFGLASGGGFETDTGDFSQDSLEVSGPLTQMGTVLGTPPYMPPEQHRAGEIDARSDQFAYCVVFYEALFGRRPFVADRLEDLARLKEAGLSQWPSEPAVPPWLGKALRKGLSPRRSGRFVSMHALLRAIDKDQRPSSKRLPLVLLGGAFVAAAGVGTAYINASPTEDPCAATREATAKIWDTERRAALVATLGSAEVSFAADTAERVGTQLDTYAGALAEARYDACAATSIRNEQSASLMDRRFACLDRAGSALRSTVAALTTDDTGVVRHAVRTTLGLPALARCADADQMLAQLEPPANPSVAAEVSAIEARLEEAEVKRRAGQHSVALADARELLISAERLGHDPTRAEVLDLLGRLLQRDGQYEEARATLLRAHHAAIGCGHDRIAADTIAQVAFVTGGLLQDHDVAMMLAEDSRAWARKLGTDDALAHHENIYATLLQQQARYAEAQRRFERVLEIRERNEDPTSLPIANALNNLANVHNDQGRNAEAAALYKRATEIAEQIFGLEHVTVGAFLNNWANARSAGGDPDGAWPLYERALAIFERTYGHEHPDVAGFIVNMASTASRRGRDDEALALYEKGLALEVKLLGDDHPRVARTMSSLAMLLSDKDLEDGRDVARARALLSDALAIHEKVFGDVHPEVAGALERLAVLDLEAGDPEGARPGLERAVAIRGATESSIRARAYADFLLAQAMWATPSDREGAVTLAQTAADRLQLEVNDADLREEINTWVGERP